MNLIKSRIKINKRHTDLPSTTRAPVRRFNDPEFQILPRQPSEDSRTDDPWAGAEAEANNREGLPVLKIKMESEWSK